MVLNLGLLSIKTPYQGGFNPVCITVIFPSNKRGKRRILLNNLPGESEQESTYLLERVWAMMLLGPNFSLLNEIIWPEYQLFLCNTNL